MESVDTALFLNAVQEATTPRWWNEFQLSFDQSLVVDRHFLSLIESKVGIGSVDESLYPSAGPTTTIETLRLILAQKFDNQLNFRELPVSLLRLYFSGQQRLTRFISRLSHTRLNNLILLLRQDGVSLPPISPSLDPYTDGEYNQKCLALEHYLRELLDYALCSFETTVKRFLSPQPFHRFGLLSALAKDSFWANFPVPQAVRREGGKGHVLWTACVWRMNVTILLCKLLSPWDDERSREWLTYQCKLFRATHLDLLAAMLKRGLYDDDSIAGAQHHLLRDNYPLSNRVCCAEELPDFTGYATDHFKTGSNLKERSSLEDKIGHIFVGKTGPNICKIRNFYDIIIRYGEEDPIIYDLLKNVIKCVLMGNLPHSRGSLNAMALIKIVLSFSKEEADKEIAEEVFKEITKNKSMKRTRSKKKTKDELVYTKTNFKLFLLLCRHFVLYLLKEFLFYIAESSYWFNESLSVDYKFLRYREIVLIGNGRCRKKLSQQAKERPLNVSFDWSVIEFEEKSTETYDTKSGEIKKYHAWSLTVARKIQKDDFMKILAKKMTNTEESICLSASYKPFYYVASEGEKATPESSISIEDVHFLCWYMAKTKDKNKNRMVETRWLQVMGMTKEGLDNLREWPFLYSGYDTPDNSLKNEIKAFYMYSAKDYMIVKTVLRLVEYYKQEHVFHLPICYAKKQIYALRRLLGVEDWEPTPPLLGYAYQCSGCLKFANAIIEPVDHRLLCHGCVVKKPATSPIKKEEPIMANGGQSAAEERRKKGRKQKTGKPESAGPTSQAEKNAAAANIVTSCFLNTALYNMDDGRLYCTKYSSGYKHAILESKGDKGQIVMRKKDGSVVVRSNKTVLLFPGVAQPPVEIAPSSGRKKSHSGASTVREREEKKFQWLLDVRTFEYNESNADDVASGLLAPNKEISEGEEVDAAAAVALTAPVIPSLAKATKPVAAAIPKKNNKKIILGYVNKAITDMKLTCNTPLTAIDMVGIVKNGKVLCVECGSMTELRNYNITNHGITCGRHKSVYESDFVNPLSSMDKRTSKKKLLVQQEQRESSLDQQDSTLVSKDASQGHTPYFSLYNNAANNAVLKAQLHPVDVIQREADPGAGAGYIEGDRCAYCANGAPKYRVTGVGHQREIVKVALCKPCYSICTPLMSKHQLPALRRILTELRQKKPL